MARPEDVLSYWLDEVDPSAWYTSSDDLDTDIRNRFEPMWHEAMEGNFGLWLTYPTGMLAYIILTDQFPRNMFRDTAKAFSSDKPALAAAKVAVDRGWDMKIDEPARQFFYLPMMHSENLCDQERAVRLILTRMPETGASNLLHAKAHREVIRRFGRFPFRNEALDRTSTAPEMAFIQEGGYGATVDALTA
ncbi:DUF924 family protein [Parasulfitobacter algicola]|uniref:DUF924 domain-containing protein n=1 Tax=Parasulfitobacter algicola TaxID=2614809 RepID=A0ABX2IYX8_9RHOB|nr:DUF924 family protein [Sulfitobacter algicola]NSX55869.1 DUF924 domain-containing protein [Sulfitobacter algicola]